MQLNNGTGCFVMIIGNLTGMPIISSAKFTESTIVVARKRRGVNETQDKIEFLRVILNRDDTTRINNFGHLGMTISIYGDIRASDETEIIANKIDFTYFPGKNRLEDNNAKQMIGAEKSYWLRHDGSMRPELTYIH